MNCQICRCAMVRSVKRKLFDDIEDWMRCDLCKSKEQLHKKLSLLISQFELNEYESHEVLASIELCFGSHENLGPLKLTDIAINSLVRTKIEALILKHIEAFRSDGRFDRFDIHSSHLMTYKVKTEPITPNEGTIRMVYSNMEVVETLSVKNRVLSFTRYNSLHLPTTCKEYKVESEPVKPFQTNKRSASSNLEAFAKRQCKRALTRCNCLIGTPICKGSLRPYEYLSKKLNFE